MDPDRDGAATADEPAQRGIVRSVKSAAALLGCFRDGRTELRLSDLAREVGLNVSTAHRLLRTLADSGLLAQDPHNDRYRPGPVLIEISRSVTVADRTASTADVLAAIAIRSGESVSLGTRSGSDAVVVMHVASPNPLRFERKVGQQISLHLSAMGKALLAFGPEPVEDALRGLDALGVGCPQIQNGTAGPCRRVEEGAREGIHDFCRRGVRRYLFGRCAGNLG